MATAGEYDNPDLFWAIRGGGGNFGVVTSFEFKAHLVPSVLNGPVLHTLDAAPALLSFYREFWSVLPDEVGTHAVFLHPPDGFGARLCAVAVCHCGANPERAETDVAALRAFESPTMDMVQRVPYLTANTGTDWLFNPGTLTYWKSAFFTELTDAAITILVEAFERAPTELCVLLIEAAFASSSTDIPSSCQ